MPKRPSKIDALHDLYPDGLQISSEEFEIRRIYMWNDTVLRAVVYDVPMDGPTGSKLVPVIEHIGEEGEMLREWQMGPKVAHDFWDNLTPLMTGMMMVLQYD